LVEFANFLNKKLQLISYFKNNRNKMLSQSPGIYILLGAVLGSIISGSLLIINTSVNNKFQLKREKEQHIWQEKSEQQKWYREKIYDSYKKLIQILTKIQQVKFQIEKLKEDNFLPSQSRFTELNNLYLEFNSEYSIIIAGHPDKDSEELYQKRGTIELSLKEQPLSVQNIITEIMIDDPRIKDINK
jgi:hypothetical protein